MQRKHSRRIAMVALLLLVAVAILPVAAHWLGQAAYRNALPVMARAPATPGPYPPPLVTPGPGGYPGPSLTLTPSDGYPAPGETPTPPCVMLPVVIAP